MRWWRRRQWQTGIQIGKDDARPPFGAVPEQAGLGEQPIHACHHRIRGLQDLGFGAHLLLMTSATTVSRYAPPPWPLMAVLLRKLQSVMEPSARRLAKPPPICCATFCEKVVLLSAKTPLIC